ncbi:diadenosine tetraphosphate hydrolase [Candidatus Peregrinibacteria bacterium CG11_big_fil_rev_8_21_14_0_20_41_10]|nr:MAG: diadenosine tetraphosphate hydrolase [Candidatus Peregrinibacteria bacterium CG11_big_fil_rev_8_21_14_0_20_41_10]PIZ76215.1 MAG: diadenosine tetraphosphate hydrolase [Candidatus Peregrinibacteria bacterium CG_4_10_14_0_2_um_filter_41_8]PJC37562.1 MAG: diadenosine tetraphosphate hydrolase [Candidatus Peregrinibacteria bacterium CG_4_9_14_0_2_um_filter_41_14]
MVVFHLSVGLVLYRKEGDQFYFLLLHYLGGHWDFVKGHLEGNETLEETAMRELEEETGIKHAMILPNFEERIHYTYYHQAQKQEKEVVVLIGETHEKEIVISDEHQDFVWLSYDEAMQKLTFENARNILKAAGQYLGIA